VEDIQARAFCASPIDILEVPKHLFRVHTMNVFKPMAGFIAFTSFALPLIPKNADRKEDTESPHNHQEERFPLAPGAIPMITVIATNNPTQYFIDPRLGLQLPFILQDKAS
jgi:hypothetical protein